MVKLDQVKNGIALYFDNEILNQIDSWQKWIIGAGVGMAINNIDEIFERYKSNEIIKMLHIVDDNGEINIEDVYKCLLNEAKKSNISIDIPSLGSITLTDKDVNKLYKYIKEG